MAQSHHRDKRYVRDGRLLRALANTNPDAVCWRDGLTQAEHVAARPHGDNRWTAGHTVDGSRTWRTWWHVTRTPPTGDWLAPEIARCNFAGGAAITLGRHVTADPERWW